MSSLRRILASQANGRKSRGPITPEGKRHSSQNAVTHGLRARRVVLETESLEVFQALLTLHRDRFRPADAAEAALVEQMAAAHWRMRRAWAVESRMLETAAVEAEAANPTASHFDCLAAAFSTLSEKPALAWVNSYEVSFHLAYHISARSRTSCFYAPQL